MEPAGETARATPEIGSHLPSRGAEFAYALVFMAVAAMLAFVPLAETTARLYFEKDAPFALAATVGEGVPVPRALTWSSTTQDLVLGIVHMSSAGVLGIEIALFAAIIYAVLRILNPTFRLTSGVDWDRSLLTRTYMHTPPLIKAFLIAMAAAMPALVGWWVLEMALGDTLFSIWVRMAAVGAAVWLLFSREGVAGDYESGGYELPATRSAVQSLLLRGAIAGTAAAAFSWVAPRINARGLFNFYQALGGIGEPRWRVIAAIACGIPALLAFCAGIIVIVLGTPGIPARQRFKHGAAAFSLFGVVVFFSLVLLPRLLITRYDFLPNPGAPTAGGLPAATMRLSELSGVPTRTPGFETMILMRPDRSISLHVGKTSIVGLEASPEAARKVERFLDSRGYQTALADPAFKSMHDAATLRWDSAETLRVIYANLTRCPDPAYVQLFLSKLLSSPNTAEVRKYVDLMADERRFAFLSRDARVQVGDLYAHFSDRPNAEKWYRSAGVPPGRIAEIMPARFMMSWGEVTGRITINGRPARRCRVGLVPAHAVREAFQSALGPGLIRPFWFRWVGPTAQTDEEGRFHVRNVIAGHYRMVIMSPDLQMPPFSRKLQVGNAPGEMFVAYGKPRFDLGDIAVTADAPLFTARAGDSVARGEL